MKIKSDRELRIATTWGVAVIFHPGIEKEVSDEIGLLALQEGAKEAGGSIPPPPEPDSNISEEIELEESADLNIEPNPDPLLEKVIQACISFIEQGDPENFTVEGKPKAAKLKAAVGESIPTEMREQAWKQALEA